MITYSRIRSRDSSVGISTRYGLDSPGIESRRGRDFPHPPWGPPSLLYNGYRVSFLVVKRPGRGADHPPPSSAEVEGRVELYICSPSEPSWPVLGSSLPLQSDSYLRYIYLLNMTVNFGPMFPGIRQGINFFSTYPDLTACPSDSSSKNMEMSMECWWDDNDRTKNKSLPVPLVHHKSHTLWQWIQPEPSWWHATD